MNESPLIRFYRGTGADDVGRRLDDILSWPDTRLEAIHDYIQWLFPLLAPSRFNPNAPILTATDRAEFRQPGPCRDNFLRAFRRMMRFYGLECDDADPEDVYITKSLIYDLRSRVWLTPGNHNYLRLSRILTACRLLGCEAYAWGLFDRLHVLYREAGGRIGQETHTHWRNAVRE